LIRLSKESEQRLIARAQRGDARAVERLLEDHLWLARKIATKWSIPGYDSQDILSVAMVGIVKAIRNFNPLRTGRLSTLATLAINTELTHTNSGFEGQKDEDKELRKRLHSLIALSQLETTDTQEYLDGLLPIKHRNSVLATIMNRETILQAYKHLTDEEIQTIGLVSDGYTFTEISEKTGQSRADVQFYASRRKIRLHSNSAV